MYPTGSEVSIPCEVEGYPPPTVHWYHDDSPVPQTDRTRMVDNELRISNATTADSGSYRCDAVNEYGASSASISIVVEGNTCNLSCFLWEIVKYILFC
jgi:hypothetical protein